MIRKVFPVFTLIFAGKERQMNVYFLLFVSLIPLAAFGEDFQICGIRSSNPLYEYLATRHLQRKRNDVVTISLKDSLAFVSYSGEQGKVIFYRCSDSANTYYKRRYGLTAYLMFRRDSNALKTARVVIWRNKKIKLSVDLKQVVGS